MKLAFDTVKLGGAMLAAGPVMMQLSSEKRVWWIAWAFTVLGPFLMSWRCNGKRVSDGKLDG